MSNYKEEMFNYLSKKENFISAFEVSQLFPDVKNELISSFWSLFETKMKVKIENSDWKLLMPDNIFETYSTLHFYFNGIFMLGFQRLHGQILYGLIIDIDSDDYAKYDREKINEYVLKIDKIANFKKNKWWLGYDFLGVDFDTIQSLQKILPENRVDFANELVDMLFNLGEELKPNILKMAKMTIK